MLDGIRNSSPLRRFRRFRYTRPFWAGLLTGAGGIEIAVLPIGPTDSLIHAGKGAFAGIACGLLLLLMAGVFLFLPSQRIVAGVIAVLVSLASFVLSNLGGFVVGMLLGILGGSLAFGWVPDKARYQRDGGRRLLRRRKPVTPEPAAADAHPTPAGHTELSAPAAPA